MFECCHCQRLKVVVGIKIHSIISRLGFAFKHHALFLRLLNRTGIPVEEFVFLSFHNCNVFQDEMILYGENRYDSNMCVSRADLLCCCSFKKVFFHDESKRKNNITLRKVMGKRNWYRSRVQSIKSKTRRTRFFFVCWEKNFFRCISKQKNSFTVPFCSGYSFGARPFDSGRRVRALRRRGGVSVIEKHHFSQLNVQTLGRRYQHFFRLKALRDLDKLEMLKNCKIHFRLLISISMLQTASSPLTFLREKFEFKIFPIQHVGILNEWIFIVN